MHESHSEMVSYQLGSAKHNLLDTVLKWLIACQNKLHQTEVSLSLIKWLHRWRDYQVKLPFFMQDVYFNYRTLHQPVAIGGTFLYIFPLLVPKMPVLATVYRFIKQGESLECRNISLRQAYVHQPPTLLPFTAFRLHNCKKFYIFWLKTYTGWSKCICAPDDYNTENYK
jgi:hypothetical protein